MVRVGAKDWGGLVELDWVVGFLTLAFGLRFWLMFNVERGIVAERLLYIFNYSERFHNQEGKKRKEKRKKRKKERKEGWMEGWNDRGNERKGGEGEGKERYNSHIPISLFYQGI